MNEEETFSVPVVSQPGQEPLEIDGRPEPRVAEAKPGKTRRVRTQVTEPNDTAFGAPMIEVDHANPVRVKDLETFRVPVVAVTDHTEHRVTDTKPVAGASDGAFGPLFDLKLPTPIDDAEIAGAGWSDPSGRR